MLKKAVKLPHQMDGSMQCNQQKNVFNSIMSFLPDNRPITSIRIVEDYENCPKDYTPINRTYDQDSDADLWRETNILFGKQTARYLCISKTETLHDFVVEELRIISEKNAPPTGYSVLTYTTDTKQKAWRKKQIAYKLTKRKNVTCAITDIIVCSKLKVAPIGFKLAGEVNGIYLCYKTGTIPTRLPPPIPDKIKPSVVSNVENSLNKLNISKKVNQPLPPIPTDHDYEEIQASYQLSPKRPAPRPPVSLGGTLTGYTELEGVPFIINPNLNLTAESKPIQFDIKPINVVYDFQLERQTLCTLKSTKAEVTNPFFK